VLQVFNRKELQFLVRALQQVPVTDRRGFWLDVRNCRRRPKIPCEQLPIAYVFATPDEYDDLATKATLSRVRFALAGMRLWPADAFRKMDIDGNGLIDSAELHKGMEAMKINVGTVAQIANVFKMIDKDNDGSINLEEFKDAFELDDLDIENIVRIEDTLSVETSTARQSVVNVTPDLPPPPKMSRTGRFRFKPYEAPLKCIWKTDGTLAESPVSFWAPRGLGSRESMRGRVFKIISLGCFASSNFNEPEAAQAIEIKDEEESGFFASQDITMLNEFVRLVLPLPAKYKLAWEMRTGKKPLFVWEPIPPTQDHIALGFWVSNDAVEPSPDEVELHCVHKSWAIDCRKDKQYKLWSNAGLGGTPATVWTTPPFCLFQILTGSSAKSLPTFPMFAKPQFYCGMPKPSLKSQLSLESFVASSTSFDQDGFLKVKKLNSEAAMVSFIEGVVREKGGAILDRRKFIAYVAMNKGKNGPKSFEALIADIKKAEWLRLS